MDYPDPEFDPEWTLDEAYDRVTAAFEGAGFTIHRSDFLNDLPQNPLRGIAKIFTHHPEGGANQCFLVHVGEWDQQAVLGFLNYAVRSEEVLHVRSAQPPPEILPYLLANEPRARFALEALAAVQDGAQLSAETVEPLASFACAQVEKHFGLAWTLDDPELLERLDELVLERLRTVEDPDEEQAGYAPASALILLGCLAGEGMRRELARDPGILARWTSADPNVVNCGLGLELLREEKKGLLRKRELHQLAVVNPIGKVFKRWKDGSMDSVHHMLEAVREMIERDFRPS